MTSTRRSPSVSSTEDSSPGPEPCTSSTHLVNECSHLSRLSELIVYKSSYAWCIRNFSIEALQASSAGLESPPFLMGSRDEFKWRMSLEDVSDAKSKMLRVRVKLQSLTSVQAKYSLVILNGEGRTSREGSMATMYSSGKGRSAVAIIPVGYLRNHERLLLPDDRLTVRCRITAQLDVPRYKLSRDLAGLLESERFSDVTLVAEGQAFPAHKAVLASRSPVFAAMFEYDMLENSENVVEIADVEPEALRELLRFVYSERVEGLDHMALDLFEAADKYALEELKLMCEDALYFGLSVENAVEVLVHADLHCADGLKKRVKRFIADHSEEVVETPGYKAIGEAQLHLLAEIFPRIE